MKYALIVVGLAGLITVGAYQGFQHQESLESHALVHDEMPQIVKENECGKIEPRCVIKPMESIVPVTERGDAVRHEIELLAELPFDQEITEPFFE